MPTSRWLAPWRRVALDAAERRALEDELYREVSRRHVLFGERVLLVARRDDADDALFELSGGRIAEVHLTWRMAAEASPIWPRTEVFDSLDDWMRERMIPLCNELEKVRQRQGPDDSTKLV